MSALTARQAKWGLAVLTLINLLNYTDRYILAGVMKKVQDHFTLSDAQGGLLATTFMVVYLVASPIGGYLGDRLPRNALIAGAVLLWSLATIASGLAGSFLLLILARAATGVGEAGYGTVAPAFISDLFRKEERSRMLSIFYTAMPLGAAAGFILGGFVGDRFGWHTAFFVGGAPGLLLALMAFGLKEPAAAAAPGAHHQSIGSALREAFGYRSFQLLMAGYFVCGFQVVFIGVHMPSYLKDQGMSPGVATTALALIGLFNVIGTYVAGSLGQRLPKRYILSTIYILRSVAIVLFLWAPLTPASVYVFSAVMGLLWLSTVPPTNAVIAQIFGVQYMSMLGGFVFLSHQVGSFLGVWLGGRLYDQFGSYDPVWYISIALGVFAALVNLPVREHAIARAQPQPA